MKTSELLRKTKRFLAESDADAERDEKCSMLCFAIGSASESAGEKSESAKCRAVERIRVSLHPHSSVCAWLRHQGIESRGDIQEYRHLWLDALIAEYEQDGD